MEKITAFIKANKTVSIFVAVVLVAVLIIAFGGADVEVPSVE